MARVYLSIGSNINREESIRNGVSQLRGHFGDLRLSAVYESAAVGFSGEPFYNLVAGLDTALPWQQVQQILREIETAGGRIRGAERFSARTLDIDLLLYDQLDLHDQGVDLPRDEILRYAFVLGPLAEVAGDECHPQNGESYRRLWEQFDQEKQPLQRVSVSLIETTEP